MRVKGLLRAMQYKSPVSVGSHSAEHYDRRFGSPTKITYRRAEFLGKGDSPKTTVVKSVRSVV